MFGRLVLHVFGVVVVFGTECLSHDEYREKKLMTFISTLDLSLIHFIPFQIHLPFEFYSMVFFLLFLLVSDRLRCTLGKV